MDKNVKILVLPTINWQGLIDLVQENLGTSPTRVLDKEKITTDEPRAVLRILESLTGFKKNIPLNHSWCHLNCSFIAKCQPNVVTCIVECTTLKSFHIKDSDLNVFSGNFNDWHLAIYTGCVSSMPLEVRKLLNECFFIFMNYNMNLWPKSTRHKLSDGTLVIEAK